MKHVLHLVRKDLTRHRIPALLVLAALALDALDVRYGLLAFLPRFFPDGLLGSILKWPLCFLFIVATVQEDRVVDPRAHWLTRPVDPLALLTAKFLAIAAVVIVPQALSQVLLAVSIGVTPATAAFIGLEILAGTTLLSLLAMLLAALRRTILETCVLIGAAMIVWVLGTWMLTEFPKIAKWLPAASGINGASRFVVVAALGLPVLAGLLAYHYRRRSFARTLTATVLALGAVLLAANYFPREIVRPRTVTAPPATSDQAATGEKTTLTFKLAGGAFGNGYDRHYDGVARRSVMWPRVAVRMEWEKSRSDRLLLQMSSTTTLHLPDGTTETFPRVWTYWDGLDLPDALRATLGLPPLVRDRPRALPLNLLALRPDRNPMPPDRPVRATTIVNFNEARLDPIWRGPAVRRATFTSGTTFVVAPVFLATDRDGAVVELRQLVPSSLLHPDGVPSTTAPTGRLAFALRHPRLNEFATGGQVFLAPSSGVGAVRAARSTFLFPHRMSGDGAKVGPLTDEWLAEAELIVYRTKIIGSGETKLEFDNLSVALDDPGELRLR